MTENDPIASAAVRSGAALEDLAEGAGARAADALETAFERAGSAIEKSLTRAAITGELSFKKLAQSVALSLADLAIDRFVEAPLEAILKRVGGGASFFGSRADGGFVTTGGGYLVGERGPEIFRPAVSGSIGGLGGAVTVNLAIGAGGDAESLRRSQAQIERAVARAVARGRRGV